MKFIGISKRDEKHYWKVVEICMIELFNVDKITAQTLINKLIERLGDLSGRNQIFYHNEAFHIAYSLATNRESDQDNPNRELFDKYLEILDRLDLEHDNRSKGQLTRRRKLKDE